MPLQYPLLQLGSSCVQNNAQLLALHCVLRLHFHAHPPCVDFLLCQSIGQQKVHSIGLGAQ
eukprot:562683-Ditylum_brightwellii.AAC.1